MTPAGPWPGRLRRGRRARLAALALAAGLAPPACDAASRGEPRGGRVVMRADGLPVSYRTYRRVLDECMPAWPSLRAALDPDRVLLTPQELVFRAAWIEPQVMRARHPVEAREDELLAWECYRKARAGEDWAELVRAYTQVGRDRYKRGDTGLVRLADLPLPWSVVMFKAPLGDVQPPVLTAFGWHVGVVREIVPARTLDDGTVEPERRRIEQVELPYTPPAGTGMSAERALRILVGELRTSLEVEVLDPRLCVEVPHFCRGDVPAPPPLPAGEHAHPHEG